MPPEAPLLAIDIGNTHTHFGRVQGREVDADTTGSLPTSALADPENQLFRWVGEQMPDADGVAYCSVVPGATRLLEAFLQKHPARPAKSCFRLDAHSCPIPIHYPNPEEIGPDRLAVAIGATLLHGPPVIVVDMGTAVTLDVVTRRGYEGGIIAPGLEIMTRYLHEQTALLPKLNPEDLAISAGIGKTTREAMNIGCSVGFAGMIEALLERVIREIEQNDPAAVTVMMTGGSTGILPRRWLERFEYHPDLTLAGVAEAFRIHRDPRLRAELAFPSADRQ